MRRLQLVLTVVVVILATVCAWAQEVERVVVRVSDERIWLGESVRVEIRVLGVGSAEGPTPAEFPPELEASFVGGSAETRQEITTINGRIRTSEQSNYVLVYSIRPREAGRVEIPPLTIRAAGGEHPTRPVTIEVVGPARSDVAVLELATSDTRVYVEEPVDLTLSVHLPRLRLQGTWLDVDPWFPNDPLALQVPWLDGLDGLHASDTDRLLRALVASRGERGFSLNGLRDTSAIFADRPLLFTLPRTEEIRGGAAWYRYDLRRRLVPTRTGTFELPLATLRGTVVSRVEERRGAPVATGEELVFVATDRPTLEVLPVPEDGRPATYEHAVGRYTLTAELGLERAQVGDPVPLEIAVRGDGLLENVRPPRLDRQPNLTELVAVGEGQVVGDTPPEERRFRYVLRPRREGRLDLPPVELAYFDPTTESFAVARSGTLRLDVDPSVAVSASEVVRDADTDRRSAPGAEREGAILANAPLAELLEPAPDSRPGLGTWAAIGGAPLILIVLLLVARGRSDDPTRRRAAGAHARARARLDAPGAASDADALHAALAGLVADHLDVPEAGLTADDLRAALGGRGVPEQLVERTGELADRLAAARYGAGGDVADLVGPLRTLLDELDAALAGGGAP